MVEIKTSFGWHKCIEPEGCTISIDRFGESGKGEEIMEYLGFTVENIVKEYLLIAKQL